MQFVGVFLGLAIAGGLLAVRVLSGRLTRAAGSVRPDGSLAAGWSQAGRLVPKLWLAFTSPAMLVSLVSLPGLIAGSIRWPNKRIQQTRQALDLGGRHWRAADAQMR